MLCIFIKLVSSTKSLLCYKTKAFSLLVITDRKSLQKLAPASVLATLLPQPKTARDPEAVI